MKVLAKEYSFIPATRTLTLQNIGSVELDQLLLVTNVTDNIIIYNFAKPELGATRSGVSGATFILDYDTTSMSSTDRLQIFVDVPDTIENTITTTLSNAHAVSTTYKAIYSIFGTSFHTQEQYLQLRYGPSYSSFGNSWNLFTAKLKPFESFKFDFPDGIEITSQSAAGWRAVIVNSSTPATVNLNNNNLQVNISTSEYTR